MAQLKVETSKSRDQHHAMGASRTKKKIAKAFTNDELVVWPKSSFIPGESLHALSSRLT